jgi:asparagine synthase (glutamine-hydrolysing)
MFRYLAAFNDASDPRSAAQAECLSAAWRARSDWRPVLERERLRVFVTGARTDVNDALSLHGRHGEGLVLGKLFRRARLGQPQCSDSALSDREQASITESQGERLIKDFWGRYIAFLPTAAGTGAVLRDPSGALPCYTLKRSGVTLIFSWLEDALQALDALDARGQATPLPVNWDAIAALARRGSLGGRETALEGVREVLAGERCDLSSGEPTLVWSAAHIARAPMSVDLEEAQRQLEETVGSCAQAWGDTYGRMLLRLSGGLDSSILLSALRPEQAAEQVVAVNYHSPGSDSDERHYARQMAQRAGCPLVEQTRDTGFRIERTLSTARMPAPIPYIGWMNAHHDARLAKSHGAAAMLAGTGGDALFYEYPRWWPAADYLYDHGARPGCLPALMDAARLGRVSVWRATSLAIQERIRPRREARTPTGLADLLTPDANAARFDDARFSHPSWPAAVELPLGKSVQTQALMYPMGYYDPFEREQAPELVNPLLSQPLVELCLRLPTYQLTAGGRGQALARRTFAKRLPEQIARRRCKGGMEEHIKAVLDNNAAFVRGLLLEGHLCRSGLINRAQLEDRLSGAPSALPGASAQIHAVVAIEAWLTRFRP